MEGTRREGWEPSITSTDLFLKALLTMALSTRRSPTCDGPRKWNISMARSVGWAWHRRLRGDKCYPPGMDPCSSSPVQPPRPRQRQGDPIKVTL